MTRSFVISSLMPRPGGRGTRTSIPIWAGSCNSASAAQHRIRKPTAKWLTASRSFPHQPDRRMSATNSPSAARIVASIVLKSCSCLPNAGYQPRRALRALGCMRFLCERELDGRWDSLLFIEPLSYCLQPLCGFPQSYGVRDFDPVDDIVP